MAGVLALDGGLVMVRVLVVDGGLVMTDWFDLFPRTPTRSTLGEVGGFFDVLSDALRHGCATRLTLSSILVYGAPCN